MTTWPGGIGAITLFVEDLDATKRFYQEVFDLPVALEDDNSAVFSFGETQLTVWVEDVDARCAQLAGRGVALLNGPRDRVWGVRTACFAGPAGHVWELAQDLG